MNQNAKKMNAFLKEVGGLKQDKYQNLVDISKVLVIDGEIDARSLKDYAATFKHEYPELIQSPTKVVETPKQTAPQKNVGENFKNLSFKEMMEYVKKNKLL